jgi:hypothetical protein
LLFWLASNVICTLVLNLCFHSSRGFIGRCVYWDVSIWEQAVQSHTTVAVSLCSHFTVAFSVLLSIKIPDVIISPSILRLFNPLSRKHGINKTKFTSVERNSNFSVINPATFTHVGFEKNHHLLYKKVGRFHPFIGHKVP